MRIVCWHCVRYSHRIVALEPRIGLAAFLECRDHRRDLRLQIGIDPGGAGGYQRRRHVALAASTRLVRDPWNIAPEILELRGVDDAREQFDRGAQAPRRYTKLMQRLGLAGLGGDLMSQYRFRAERDRFARRVCDCLSGGKCNPARWRIGARGVYHRAIPCASMRRCRPTHAACRWRPTNIRRCVCEARPAAPRSASARRRRRSRTRWRGADTRR